MTYKPGITNTPNTVPNNMPPVAVAPIVLLPIAPAPLANNNGINPAMNANEVIKIGLNLTLAASIAASKGVLPSLCFSVANSTIYMAFLPNNPINMIIAIWA